MMIIVAVIVIGNFCELFIAINFRIKKQKN